MRAKLLRLTIISIMLLPMTMVGQSIESFQRLEAKGDIPKDLLELVNSNEKIKDKHEAKLRAELKDLVLGGKILFGDTVSVYINKILDRLLASEPELRKEIKLYIIKSHRVNAFATSNGYLFITTGFIAQSTSEADIAFAISHELIHYVEKHGYNLKDKHDDLKDYLVYHARSREQEFECDRKGYLNYYTKAGYYAKSPLRVYDILEFAYLPFDEIKYSREDVDHEYFKFHDRCFITSITPIADRSKGIDTFSTHPNLASRRQEMMRLIEENKEEGSRFIMSESEFNYIQTLSRFETINQEILSDIYVKSYYNTDILLRQYPNNSFLTTARIASIYGISKAKQKGSYSQSQLVSKDVEGEMQFLAYFFERISKREASLLALRAIYAEIEPNTNKSLDKYYRALFDDIIKDLDQEKLNSLDMFSDLRMDEEEPERENDAEEDEDANKYDRIRSSRIVGHQKNFRTENYMLGDLKQDSVFVDMFESSILKLEEKNVSEFISQHSKDGKEVKKVDTLILFSPYISIYKKDLSLRKTSLKNQNLSKKFENNLEKIARSHGVEPIIVSATSYDTNMSYQLRAKLYDLAHGINKFSILYYENRDMDDYLKEMNTPYIAYISIDKKTGGSRKSYYELSYLVSSIIFSPYYIPIALYESFLPRYLSNTYFHVYDLENSEFITSSRRDYDYSNYNNQEINSINTSMEKIGPKTNWYKRHGYLSKRFILSLHANISPAVFTPNQFGDKGYLKFDYAFAPSLEFVLNSKLSIGGSFSKMKTMYEQDFDGYPIPYPSESYGLDINTYSGFLKYYQSVAPIGYYYKLQLDYHNYITQGRNSQGLYDIEDSSFGLRIEYGRMVYFGKYLQVGTGLSIGGILSNRGFFPSSDYYKSYEDCVNTKIARAYTIGLNLNIGIIPF